MVNDLDILHRSSCAHGFCLQALENRFLGAPATGERSARVGGFRAIVSLGLGEIALNECRIFRIDAGDVFDVNTHIGDWGRA